MGDRLNSKNRGTWQRSGSRRPSAGSRERDWESADRLHELLCTVHRRRHSINFVVSIRSRRLILNRRATAWRTRALHCGPDVLFRLPPVRPINQLSTRRIMRLSISRLHRESRRIRRKMTVDQLRRRFELQSVFSDPQFRVHRQTTTYRISGA